MAVNKEPIFVGVLIGGLNAVAGTGGGYAMSDLHPTDANATIRIDSFVVCTDDQTQREIVVQVKNAAGTVYNLGAVLIPANSGQTNAILPVNVFAHANMAPFLMTDAAGNKFLNLPPGWAMRLYWSNGTSGRYLIVTVRGGKYADA